MITAIAALAGAVMGVRNSRKIQEVHLSVNSRMDQLLEAAKAASHAAGVAAEKTSEALKKSEIATGEVVVPEQKLKIEFEK